MTKFEEGEGTTVPMAIPVPEEVRNVIDETGERVEDDERRFATWADLCEPPEPKEYEIRPGVFIKYMPYMAYEELAELQRRCTNRRTGQTDYREFAIGVLKRVMIHPKVTTRQDQLAVLKASSSVVLGVIATVVDQETMEKIKEGLGEA